MHHLREEAAAGRLHRPVADHRRQAVLRQRPGRRGRAAPAVADGARQPGRGVQQAHDPRRDLGRARQDHDRRRGRRPDQDAKSIGVEIVDVRLRRVELPRRRQPARCSRAWSPSGSASRTSCARSARPSPRRSAPTPTASASCILADAYKQAQKTKGEGDAKASAIYAAGLRRESRVLRVLPQPRGLPGDVPEQVRRDGPRTDPPSSSATSGTRAARFPSPAGSRARDGRWPGDECRIAARGARAGAASSRGCRSSRPRVWRDSFRRLLDLTDGQLRFIGLVADRARACSATRSSPHA